MHGPVSKIAFVGCGAVVEQHYLPALRDCSGVSCEALVDPERPRIEQLAVRHGIPNIAASLDDLSANVDGILVAVPNDLHLKIVSDAVERGADVLCEKPVGRNVAEVNAMVTAATSAKRRLFAAMVCRRYPAIRETATHRLHELVGELQGIEASYGVPLDWPVKSPAFYDKARSGGGSLLDFGAHLVDALLHMLGNPSFDVIDYADDAEAGVDAEAEGRIALMLAARRVDCRVSTSRLRRLPNSVLFRGSKGTLDVPMSPSHPGTLRIGAGEWSVTGHLGSILPCFVEQLEDFGRAIRNEPHDLPAGSSQLPSLGLIETMYARRKPLTFAWDA